MSAIAKSVKGADRVILATDPDREGDGEAISWHVLEVLKNKKVLKDFKADCVTFNAIAKTAVSEAMAKPREIDAALVDANLARRAPSCWDPRGLNGLSIGRVRDEKGCTCPT